MALTAWRSADRKPQLRAGLSPARLSNGASRVAALLGSFLPRLEPPAFASGPFSFRRRLNAARTATEGLGSLWHYGPPRVIRTSGFW